MATLNPHRLSTHTASIEPGLTIVESYDGRSLTTLRLRGFLDTSTLGALRDALHRHDSSATSLMLDLTGIREIDTAGVSTVLAFAMNVRARGGRMAVIAPDSILDALVGSTGEIPFAVSVTMH